MKRAVRAAQKEERRQAMVGAAWGLFQQRPYDAVNIIDVAKAVGVAKGTVYLYFGTKEALFLAVLTEQFAGWFTAVDARLAELPGPGDGETVAAVLTETLAARPSLTRLFAILHVVLENNIDYETAVAFKQMLLTRITRTGHLLEETLPFLGAGEGARLLMQAYALVIGYQHLSNQAPVVQTVLANEPDMAVFDVNFAQDFGEALTTLLAGAERRYS